MSNKRNPAETVAILLIGLGEEIATELIQNLDYEAAQRILSAASKIKNIDQQTIEEVLGAFAESLTQNRPADINVGEFTKKLINKSFSPELSAEILQSLPKEIPQSFRDAENIDSRILWQILQHEHPQILAIVLAHISHKAAGQLAKLMPNELRVEVLAKLAKLESVDQTLLADVDEVLSAAIKTANSQTMTKLGGMKQTAQILAQLPNAQREDLLKALEEKNPPLASEIKANLFTFQDIINLDRSAVVKILATFPPDDIETALRGCPQKLAEHFWNAMSERRAEQVKESIKLAKPIQKSKVEATQRKIALKVAEMIAHGEITDPLDEVV